MRDIAALGPKLQDYKKQKYPGGGVEWGGVL